jgi:hypothetical protein
MRLKSLKRHMCEKCWTLFISDWVKIELANARAKGKLIGRKKMRDSDLIRKLDGIYGRRKIRV